MFGGYRLLRPVSDENPKKATNVRVSFATSDRNDLLRGRRFLKEIWREVSDLKFKTRWLLKTYVCSKTISEQMPDPRYRTYP